MLKISRILDEAIKDFSCWVSVSKNLKDFPRILKNLEDYVGVLENRQESLMISGGFSTKDNSRYGKHTNAVTNLALSIVR